MRHNLPTSNTFPKNYTAPIWMKKLEAELIYCNLNRWQISNEAAHATESAEEYRKTREIHQSTITALYQSKSTNADLHSLYRQPLEDILTMLNDRLVNLLKSHSASSSYSPAKPRSTPNTTSIIFYNTKQKDEIKSYVQPSKVARGTVSTFDFPRNL